MPAYTTDSGDSGGHRQVIATAVLVVLAVAMAYLPSSQQEQIASALRGTVLQPFLVTQVGISEARSRATDSESLRAQLDTLVALTADHSSLAEENRRLRDLLAVKEKAGPAWVSATVVRPRTAGSESTFLLDVGSESGVEPYAPVIARQGLVGVVREVRAGSAIGMDWTHPDFRASAVDSDGVTYGIVESRRGEFREDDRLVFNGTVFHERVEEGTVVMTSGLGGVFQVFPRGIPIGKVVGLAEADAGWRKSYWLQPMAEVGSATHVLVGAGPGARDDLSGVWPGDSLFTDTEVALRERMRENSLRALSDSVQLLRVLLSASAPARDSLFARLLLPDTAAAPSDSPVGPAAAQPTPRPAQPGVQPNPRPAQPAVRPAPRPAARGDTSSVPIFPPPVDTLRVGAP